MVDVLKIAVERRAALASEVMQLEEFVRMGEFLLRSTQRSPAGIEIDRKGGAAAGMRQPQAY